MTKLTDASKANKSGASMEKKLQSFLIQNCIPYKYQTNGKSEIDFIIGTDDNLIYADCTNQNETGSVDEKLPHKIWKYYKKYKYDVVYIIRGTHIPNKSVISHCQEIGKINGFNFNLVVFEEFCDIINNKSFNNTLEIFL